MNTNILYNLCIIDTTYRDLNNIGVNRIPRDWDSIVRNSPPMTDGRLYWDVLGCVIVDSKITVNIRAELDDRVRCEMAPLQWCRCRQSGHLTHSDHCGGLSGAQRHTPAILHTLECVNTARLGEILTISFINNTDVTWPAPSHLRQCLRYESNPLTLTVWQAELDIFESFRKQSKPQYGGSGRSCPDSNGFTGHREVLLLQTENTRRHSITNNATT